MLESLTGAGAVIGSLVALRWRPRRPVYAGLALMFMWPVMNGAFALSAPEAVMAVIAVVSGVAFSLFGIWWETALARNIPPRALSRVSAYDWMGSLALLPLGFALSGPLAAATSPQLVLGVGGAVTAALIAAALLPRATRRLTREDSAEDLAGEVGEEGGGEAEIADVDALVGVVHQRRGLQ